MAYAAVASLLQTLDYLFQFPSLVCEATKIRCSENPSSTLKSLSVLSSTVMLVCEKIRCGEIREDFFENSTIVSADMSQTRAVLKDSISLNALSHEEMDEMITRIIESIQESDQVSIVGRARVNIAFLWKFSLGIAFVRRNLQSLLPSLDDYSKICDDQQFLNHIKDLTYRARDLVEESMVDNKVELTLACFIANRLKNIHTGARNDVMQVLMEVFTGKKGVHGSLLKALEEIQYIQLHIRTLRGESGDMNVQILSSEFSGTSLRDSSDKEALGGLDDEQLRILGGLTGLPSSLETVTIVGMGGIGKTTLARKLFLHPYTGHHFYCRAWITISHTHELRKILLGLLSSFVQTTDEIMEKSSAQLAEDVYRSLKGRRYLIVIDDMWSIDAWNEVKSCFPDDKIGSRIIITSRFTELANHVSPKSPPHFMKILDTERSWELLEKLVFGISNCSLELLEVGKEIAKRCHGLPLAIVVVAGILSRTRKTNECWKHIAENLSSIASFTDSGQFLDILAMSYTYLPHHLKACFLYMGAFPEDCEIEAGKLIKLWMAEGFIFSDCPTNLDQIAEGYLQELISRNLVLVEKRSFGGEVKTCRLHDFMRELCLRESKKENFMMVFQREGREYFPAGIRSQRRLSFHSDPYRDILAAPALPQVSSFLCFTLGSDIVPDVLFFQLGFKLLRVLDIYFLHFEHFPEQIIVLIHLRYLALSVTFELPVTISQLRNLQSFVIQGPWLSSMKPTLSLEYWNMTSLRHLHTSVVCQLKSPPRIQENLPQSFVSRYLQTLSTIGFSNCRKEVFAVMPHLKSLGICETEDDYNTDRSCYFLNNFIFLEELESLKCGFYIQTRPRRLSCLGAFPSTLRQLSLSWSYMPWEDITPIAMLPMLQVLKLKNYAFQGSTWMLEADGFRSLKHLLIHKTDLVLWEATLNQFPRLQKLIIKSCKQLEVIPFGVDAIGSLERIEVHYCSEPVEILAKEIQEQVEGIDVVIRSDRAADSA